ncbi:MAG: DUF58 domain-containing protein [Actinomycetota bacterium]
MLTRSGLGALVAGLLLLAGGVVWRYEELLVAAVAIGVALLAALWIARRPLRTTVQRRVGTLRVARGDAIRVVHRVRNDSRYRAAGATVHDRCDDEEVSAEFEPVRANDVVDIPLAIPTRRRGLHRLGPLEVRRLDPFGLAVGAWRDAVDESSPISVTVHPKVYDLIGPQGSTRVVENEATVRRAATDPMSGFVSMREYVLGDDPRLIHWPTTARTGTLMVREHIEVRRPEFTIVVDTSDSVATPEDFEEMVDVAASLAVHAIVTGLDVVVRTTSQHHRGSPSPIVDEAPVLELLTPVHQTGPAETVSLGTLFVHGFDHTSIVFVTGPDGPSSTISSVERTTTIRIGDGAEIGVGITLAAQSAPEFVNTWRFVG